MSQPLRTAKLLDDFIADAVADDYDSAPVRLQHSKVSIWGALLTAGLGLVITVALLQHLNTADQRQATRDVLTARVTTASANVDAGTARVAKLRGDVDALTARLAADPAERRRLADLSSAAALAPLSGAGVVVTMADSPSAASESLNRVLDRDVQDVVNALWQAGATGIAVNGTRLTQLSAIRSAGDAILVDYAPMTPPYRIEATGITNVGTGTASLVDGLTSDYGLLIDISSTDVSLPAGSAREITFATPVTSVIE